MNATQILESKGIDTVRANEIVYFELDLKVREQFCVADHAVHLWDIYAIGDANENQLMIDANCDGESTCVDDLLNSMTIELNRLASNYDITEFQH